MTGGYQCFTRGIPINIPATLRQVTDRDDFTMREFEDFLKALGLKEKKIPNFHSVPEGFVIFGTEEGDDSVDSAIAVVADCYYEFQDWVAQRWTEWLSMQCLSTFYDPDVVLDTGLRNRLSKWNGALVLADDEVGIDTFRTDSTKTYVLPFTDISQAWT